MNLTTQLRIILLLVGAAIWLGIYLMGKRRTTTHAPDAIDPDEQPLIRDAAATFSPQDAFNEEELETPAYMRRQGQRETRQDYEPRIANARDYDDIGEVHDDGQHFVDIGVNDPHREFTTDDTNVFPPAAEPIYADSALAEPSATEATGSVEESTFGERYEPRMSFDDSFEVTAVPEPHLPVASLSDFDTTESERVTASSRATQTPESQVTDSPIPVMAEPVATTHHAPPRQPERSTTPATPTLSDVVNQPAQPMASAPTPTTPTKSTAGAAARRKIIALRLPIPERVVGSELLSLFEREQLRHGKFSIFHRLHESSAVFSVASIVEPGTFDPSMMAEQQFPGVTLFMLLPGPLDGLVAYDQMLSCAQRLAHATAGTLQDERGSKLTTQIMERLRDEVLDFQHLLGGVATTH
jgi:cell division protein ZipA